MADEDDYELLPHKEIDELKQELARLKDFEVTPSKKLQVSIIELNQKLDKLITIFEDAAHEMRAEESSLSFAEKMQPLLDKMNKILDQNAEIASGILAVADMLRGTPEPRFGEISAPNMPPKAMPPIPPPPKRTFGI